MREFRMHVPTYNASAFPKEVEAGERPDFGDPYVPVVVRDADGVRIVLGSLDYSDCDAPDVQIERRPNGWAIFLHPLGGCDPSGLAYFLDDGRSFVVPERDLGATPAIVTLHCDESVDEVDNPNVEPVQADRKSCGLCDVRYEVLEDGRNGLCKECADLASAYLDRNNLTPKHFTQVVAFLKTGPRGHSPSSSVQTASNSR